MFEGQIRKLDSLSPPTRWQAKVHTGTFIAEALALVDNVWSAMGLQEPAYQPLDSPTTSSPSATGNHDGLSCFSTLERMPCRWTSKGFSAWIFAIMRFTEEAFLPPKDWPISARETPFSLARYIAIRRETRTGPRL